MNHGAQYCRFHHSCDFFIGLVVIPRGGGGKHAVSDEILGITQRPTENGSRRSTGSVVVSFATYPLPLRLLSWLHSDATLQLFCALQALCTRDCDRRRPSTAHEFRRRGGASPPSRACCIAGTAGGGTKPSWESSLEMDLPCE